MLCAARILLDQQQRIECAMRISDRSKKTGRTAPRRRSAAMRAPTRGFLRAAALALAILLPGEASAMPPEFMDKAAGVLAVVILVLVPVGGILLFWMVHVLPEKIAEKRHHPQKEAIHTLCLLSLVFGGLLWPLAWLWAYTKPVFHQ